MSYRDDVIGDTEENFRATDLSLAKAATLLPLENQQRGLRGTGDSEEGSRERPLGEIKGLSLDK